jgi:uncharacterized membrane protein YraQ (UPF0718 family)
VTTRLTCSLLASGGVDVWDAGGRTSLLQRREKAIESLLKRRACREIRQLEKELGTPLFHRRTRGVELTDTGKLMLEEARAASPFLLLAAAIAPAISTIRCKYEITHTRLLDKRSSAAFSWVGQNDVRLHKDL